MFNLVVFLRKEYGLGLRKPFYKRSRLHSDLKRYMPISVLSGGCRPNKAMR